MNDLQELMKAFQEGYEKGKKEAEEGYCPKCLECNEIVTSDEGCYCVPCSSKRPEDDYETPKDEAQRQKDEGHYEESKN